MSNVILGVHMGEWDLRYDQPSAVRWAMRYGEAPGVCITHVNTRCRLTRAETHELVVDWPGRKNGVGTGACCSFDEAMSKLRRAMVAVGHDVFGSATR